MGSLKLEQRLKVETDQKRSQEIQENGEKMIEVAEIQNEKMKQMEIVDEDDAAAIDAAHMEAKGIAKEIAESEIREPGSEVGESFTKTSNQSTELSETEIANAEKASEMEGDYGETGGKLEKEFQESGKEFQEVSEESDHANAEMQSILEQEEDQLEGVF